MNQLNEEKKLAALRALLKRRDLSHPSKASDKTIIELAELESRKNVQSKRARWKTLWVPVGVAGNTLASFAVTAIVFLVMAQIVVPTEFQVDPAEAQPVNANNAPVARQKLAATDAGSLQRQPGIESYTPDQVLLELSLPSVAELVKSMEFVAEAERSQATIELIEALADIEFSIGVGHFEDARQRYRQLRQRCYACDLPSTLEALALMDLDDGRRG